MPFDAAPTHLGQSPVLSAPRLMQRVRDFVGRRRWFMVLVVAPTALTLLYMYLIAANQYISESRFIVRGQQSVAPSILGQVFGSSSAPATEESQAVVSFLKSHDAVRALRRDLDLVAVFRRNGLDLAAGLKSSPSEEEITRFYLRQVRADISTTTGITTLTARAFRPADAKLINERLLAYSEGLVNQFSIRAERDSLRVAEAEVQRYADRVADLTNQVTRFRDVRQSLDPQSSARVLTEVVGGLEAQLARARAELSAQQSYLTPSSPRVREQQTRIAALQAQVQAQRARLTGGQSSLAPTVAGFERLTVERELANRGYASALTSLEAARVDAQKQHLYLIRVVAPNLPEKSTHPRRAVTVLGVLGSLLLAYGIGWLILAGVREHAA